MSGILSVLALATMTAVPSSSRRAVLVGSNAPIEGREGLRYAHLDAKSLADVLSSNGGFPPQHIVTLLDPTPEMILDALDAANNQLREAGEGGTLLFYYSGHADQNALYPDGRALSHVELRNKLVDPVGLRLGIIDACRGGGWTQAKGLKPAAGFEVASAALGSEGLALIAASSGLEDAHEAEEIQGSFFTHHFVAGLRGAADTTGDGQITLHEAFAYANQLTVRDTAARTSEPQHPSFDFRIHGRQDVVLASLGNATTLVLAQRAGPLEVVQLATGVTVVEATPGARVLRLSLPPGPYLVRRLVDGKVHSKEVTVSLNQETLVEESSLTLVGTSMGGVKGLIDKPPRVIFFATGLAIDPEAGHGGLAMSAGAGGRIHLGWRLWGSLEAGYARVSSPASIDQHGTWFSGGLRLNLIDARITPFVEAAFQTRSLFANGVSTNRTSLLPMLRIGIDYVSPKGVGVYDSHFVLGFRLEGSLQKSVTSATPWMGALGGTFIVGFTL